MKHTILGGRSSSSSSSPSRRWKYEVFLSFRGEDTRNGFTAHLFSALQRKGIFVFKDDKRLQKGDSISRELLKAIEQSRISIVIFSKNYADSTWCLEELAKISERIFEPGYIVVPVFYHVDRSEVQTQRGSFKEAFDKHEQNFSDSIVKVQQWRQALTQVANLSGWDVWNKSELEVIDKIVSETTSNLGRRLSSLANDLVGIQSRVEALENILNLDSNKVQFVGIWGMAGIGKTTLAAVLYDKISYQFDASCFLLDVSGAYKNFGILHLQQQLLHETTHKNPPLSNHDEGTYFIRAWLCRSKTLVVIDNVDDEEQLNYLVGRHEWFGKGSRIIITSRDEHILKMHEVDKVYEAELLKDEEALQLLCRKAFKSDDPLRDSDSLELTHLVLQYTQALPLSITVLGSFLSGRPKFEWIDVLEKLKKNPHKEVMDVLETSYHQLKTREKEIFVDIACFFKGAEVSHVQNILSDCGFNSTDGFQVLRNRSLISIVNGKLWMHDVLQQLGRKIARGEFPEDPARWSRLWSYQDLQDIQRGTRNVKAIVLNQQVPKEISFRSEVLSQMSSLRLLVLPEVEFSGNLNNLSKELRFFSWQKFPFNSLPSSFEPFLLVELVMPESNITHLWQEEKWLPSLRSIDLRGSKHLVETPNLSGAVKLEKLNLEGCTRLSKVHPSIGRLKKLLFLNLKRCIHLISIPKSLFLLSSLETLNLSRCSRLRKIFQV